jgi:hypothetical protein
MEKLFPHPKIFGQGGSTHLTTKPHTNNLEISHGNVFLGFCNKFRFLVQ